MRRGNLVFTFGSSRLGLVSPLLGLVVAAAVGISSGVYIFDEVARELGRVSAESRSAATTTTAAARGSDGKG